MEISQFKSYFKSHFKVTSSFISGISLMLIDALLLILSIGAGFFIVNLINHEWINFRSFVTYSVYLPAILIVFAAASLYPGILLAPQEEVKRFSMCTFFSFAGICISINLENNSRWPICAALAIAWFLSTLFLPLGREIFRRVFGRSSWWGVPAIIYSYDGNGKVITDRLLKSHYYGYIPAAIITNGEPEMAEYKGVPVFKNSPEVLEAIKSTKVKVAILCEWQQTNDSLLNYYRYLIAVPKNQSSLGLSLHMKDFGGILGYSCTNHLTRRSNLFMKRLLDVFLCLLASPLVILLTVIIAILVKITSPGPVFYGHKRVGKNHKEFKCWKFRSMCIDSQEQLAKILATDPVRAAEWEKDRKFTDDPRVTKLGKFLRKTSLDEIPQLFNILIGQMSFVGPRPVTEPELKKYGKYQDYILSVTPGLSGMWQISGRSDTGYEERITLDSYYIQNWSIWLDIWIIIKTVWVVIKGKGAY